MARPCGSPPLFYRPGRAGPGRIRGERITTRIWSLVSGFRTRDDCSLCGRPGGATWRSGPLFGQAAAARKKRRVQASATPTLDRAPAQAS